MHPLCVQQYLHIYNCAHVHAYIYVCTQTHASTCKCIYVYVCSAFRLMPVDFAMQVCVCVCVCVCVSKHLCMHVSTDPLLWELDEPTGSLMCKSESFISIMLHSSITTGRLESGSKSVSGRSVSALLSSLFSIVGDPEGATASPFHCSSKGGGASSSTAPTDSVTKRGDWLLAFMVRSK